MFAQLAAFKAETGHQLPQSWGKKAQNKFRVKEEPAWRSEELGVRVG